MDDEIFWEEITAPPNYGSFPLSLNGSLYAVGGLDSESYNCIPSLPTDLVGMMMVMIVQTLSTLLCE